MEPVSLQTGLRQFKMRLKPAKCKAAYWLATNLATLALIILITQIPGQAHAAVEPWPTAPDHLPGYWLKELVALLAAGGAIYNWHKLRKVDEDDNDPPNVVEKYLDDDPEKVEATLASFLAETTYPEELSHQYKEILDEEAIIARPSYAFVAALAKWKDAWDKLQEAGGIINKCQKLLYDYWGIHMKIPHMREMKKVKHEDVIKEIPLFIEELQDEIKAARTFMRTLVWDTSRPSEDADMSDIMTAVEEYINEMYQFLHSSQSPRALSTQRIREELEALRQRFAKFTDAAGTNLEDLLDSLNTWHTRFIATIGSGDSNDEATKGLSQAMRLLNQMVGSSTQPLKKVTEELEKYRSNMSVLIEGQDKYNFEFLETRLEEMIGKANSDLPAEFQINRPNLDHVVINLGNIASGYARAINKIPTNGTSGWVRQGRLLLHYMDAAVYLSKKAGIAIMDENSQEKILKELQGSSPVKTDWARIARQLGIESLVVDEQDFITTCSNALSQPSNDPLFWQQLAIDCGADTRTAQRVNSQGTFTRVARTAAMTSSGVPGGTNNDLATLLSKTWKCEEDCPAPQYNGECSTVLVWEDACKRKLRHLWNKDDEGFGNRAINIFRDAMCERAAGWADYQPFEQMIGKATNFGEAFQILIDKLVAISGVDRAELEHEAKRDFACKPIDNVNCWPEFIMEFERRAGKAGLQAECMQDDNETIKNRLLETIPSKYRNLLNLMAQNQSSDLTITRKAHDLKVSEIRAQLAQRWQKPQEEPGLPACKNKACKSGLPTDVCQCKTKQVNFGEPTEPRNAERNARCLRNHTNHLTDEQRGVVMKQLKGLSAKNDEQGSSPRFRACQNMGICSNCLAKFGKPEKFDAWWASFKEKN